MKNDPDGDPGRDQRAIDGTEEPRGDFIDFGCDRNPHADAEGGGQRPPAPDDQTENEAAKNEHRIHHDSSIGLLPPACKGHGYLAEPLQLKLHRTFSPGDSPRRGLLVSIEGCPSPSPRGVSTNMAYDSPRSAN